MKKLILLLAVTLVVFSCSKDNVNTETETADLTQMTPNKSLDQSSEGMYYGVFGHNEIQDLHGKILINAGNDGNYSALIEMVNGDDIKFQGNSINKTNIHFTSDRGSFDFNTVDFTAPEATNVFIDNASESYIVATKSHTRGGGFVMLGTYVETGNETGFFGNWDAIGDGSDPFVQPIILLAVSHKGTIGPFTDPVSEINPTGCLAGSPATLIDGTLPGIDVISAEGQVSPLAGIPALWRVTRDEGGYYDDACSFEGPGSSGFWTWAGRSGTISVDDPQPLPIQNIIPTFSK